MNHTIGSISTPISATIESIHVRILRSLCPKKRSPTHGTHIASASISMLFIPFRNAWISDLIVIDFSNACPKHTFIAKTNRRAFSQCQPAQIHIYTTTKTTTTSFIDSGLYILCALPYYFFLGLFLTSPCKSPSPNSPLFLCVVSTRIHRFTHKSSREWVESIKSSKLEVVHCFTPIVISQDKTSKWDLVQLLCDGNEFLYSHLKSNESWKIRNSKAYLSSISFR